MGSVSRCRKRDSAMGGSAREAFVKSHKGCCFQLLGFCPAFGSNKSKFVSGWDDPKFSDHPSSDGSSRMSSLHGSDRNVYKKSSSSMISYGTKKDAYYALKSIHLDRCSSEEFKKELKNEGASRLWRLRRSFDLKSHACNTFLVEILKNLDHPNIVRAIETFDYRDRLFIVLELCSGGDLYSRDVSPMPTRFNQCWRESRANSPLHHTWYAAVQRVSGAKHCPISCQCHILSPFERYCPQRFEIWEYVSFIVFVISKRKVIALTFSFLLHSMFVSQRSDEIKLIDFGLSQKARIQWACASFQQMLYQPSDNHFLALFGIVCGRWASTRCRGQ